MRGLEILLVIMAAAVGGYLHTGGAGSRPVVLGFEAVAVVAGFYVYSTHHVVLPGTFIAMVVLFRVATTPHVATPSPAATPTPQNVRWQPPTGDACPTWQPQHAAEHPSRPSPAWPADYFGSSPVAEQTPTVRDVTPPSDRAVGGANSDADRVFAPPPGWQP
jgi:hypothetical protein